MWGWRGACEASTRFVGAWSEKGKMKRSQTFGRVSGTMERLESDGREKEEDFEPQSWSRPKEEYVSGGTCA